MRLLSAAKPSAEGWRWRWRDELESEHEREQERDHCHERDHGRKLERGSVAAEFAAVIPAVILILAFGLTSMQLVGQQVRLQDAAADAARILGRGDSPALATEVARRVSADARIEVSHPSGLVCVTVAVPAPSPLGTALRLTLTARSCALEGGG
ncbi:MAG: TadE family type IV pilus minor pilin [Microbacteriaceae bacterium]